VVQYNGTYYIYKGADGATNSSWNSSNWESFGAQFSSVATDLLLAINANVGGWIFKNERLESQSGGAFLDGRNGTVAITGKLSTGTVGGRIEIDPADRSIKLIDGGGSVVARLSFGSTDYSQAAPKLELFTSDGSPWSEAIIIDHSGITVRGSRAGSTFAQFGADGIYVPYLPTSSLNLSKGSFYNDNGVVKVKL
jgi:hypothetical protein